MSMLCYSTNCHISFLPDSVIVVFTFLCIAKNDSRLSVGASSSSMGPFVVVECIVGHGSLALFTAISRPLALAVRGKVKRKQSKTSVHRDRDHRNRNTMVDCERVQSMDMLHVLPVEDVLMHYSVKRLFSCQ